MYKHKNQEIQFKKSGDFSKKLEHITSTIHSVMYHIDEQYRIKIMDPSLIL